MYLNAVGESVSRCWRDIPRHFPRAALDEFVVMPNHLHGLIHIADYENNTLTHVGAKQGSSASPCPAPPYPESSNPTQSSGKTTKGKADEPFALPLRDKYGTIAGSLGAIVQNFKSVSTRRANKTNGQRGVKIWQRNYYDRIIRNEIELRACRDYIVNNPLKWDLDDNNPANV